MTVKGADMSKPRVLILGGGFAALEAAFLMRMRMRDAADITLVSDSHEFVFRPNTIYIPFGADPSSVLVGLHKPLARRHIAFQHGSVTGVDPAQQMVELADGRQLDYDRLIVATGAAMAPAEVPGLAEHAATIWTAETMLDVRERFMRVRSRARRGQTQRVLFLVPPNNKCAGPLYEIVLMLETWLRREGVREKVDIGWTTYEQSYIQAFGPRLHDVVKAEFAERGIEGWTNEIVEEVRPGEVRYVDGSVRGFDELIAFPPYVSAVRYEALPSDDRGFIGTDLGTRQVIGHPDIYAPGDAGDFPIKQAFLAFLQADTVAEHISSSVSKRPFTHPFDPVSMCVMEMFDKATFAQVPLELTGDAAHPVRVRPDANGAYKVGTSPAWRLGKKVLGFTVPARFSQGDPFHAGKAWQVMDMGLKGMAGVLAD